MFTRFITFGLFSILTFGLGACGPAPEPEPEPVAEVEEEPPPPPPTMYELTEVAISEDEPNFTSQNVTILGVTLGDRTNDVVANLGDQTGDTLNAENDYLTLYQDAGIIVYTFKQTGVARRLEVTSQFADEIVDTNIKAWLEDGNAAALREWLGEEEALEQIPENNNATEFSYDSRGLRFIVYSSDAGDLFAIRFSQL